MISLVYLTRCIETQKFILITFTLKVILIHKVGLQVSLFLLFVVPLPTPNGIHHHLPPFLNSIPPGLSKTKSIAAKTPVTIVAQILLSHSNSPFTKSLVSNHFIDEVVNLEFVGIKSIRHCRCLRFEHLFVIRNCGVDEFGACKNEKLFVPFFPRFNFGEIVGMLFAYNGCNRIIEEWGQLQGEQSCDREFFSVVQSDGL